MRPLNFAIWIILFIAAILIIGLLGGVPLSLRWLLVMGVMVLLLVVIGSQIAGRFDGVLIDPRNKISLSRLQLVLWTVVVLSAWMTLALHRVGPLLIGRVSAADPQLVETVAGVLAGDGAVDETRLRQATAVVEQVMGEDSEEGASNRYQPLDIAIPNEVLLALGISVASLAGAGLIRNNQATRDDGRGAQEVAAARLESLRDRAGEAHTVLETMEAGRDRLEAMTSNELEALGEGMEVDQAALERDRARLARMEGELRVARQEADRATKRALELEEARQTAVGDLHFHESKADASWSDLVRGDTIANFQYPDLGKIQMFLFTVVLVFGYAALLWGIMSMPQSAQVLHIVPSVRLPEFSQTFVTTLALSHGGYLVTKTTV